MSKPIDLQINVRLWFGEYYIFPIRIFGTRYDKIVPKIHRYHAKITRVSDTDVCGNQVDFNLFYN